MKKLMLIICTIMLLCTLTGCIFYDRLSSKRKMISEVTSSLPNAKFIKVEKNKKAKNNIYYFYNNGVEFTVKNYLNRGELSLTYDERNSDNYMSSVTTMKLTELDKLLNKYPSIRKTCSSCYDSFYFKISEYQNFDILSKFINEYINIVEEYLPYKEGIIDSTFYIALDFNAKYTDISLKESLCIDNLDNIRSNFVNELRENYLKYVKEGYIEDNTIS